MSSETRVVEAYRQSAPSGASEAARSILAYFEERVPKVGTLADNRVGVS